MSTYLFSQISLKRFSQPCFQPSNIPSYTINLVLSFIDNFLLTSFQQKNEIKKGNNQVEFKYLLF